MDEELQRLREAIARDDHRAHASAQAASDRRDQHVERGEELLAFATDDLIPAIEQLQHTFKALHRVMRCDRVYNDSTQVRYKIEIDRPPFAGDSFKATLRGTVHRRGQMGWTLEPQKAGTILPDPTAEAICTAIMQAYTDEINRA